MKRSEIQETRLTGSYGHVPTLHCDDSTRQAEAVSSRLEVVVPLIES